MTAISLQAAGGGQSIDGMCEDLKESRPFSSKS
jgi:hypothetical protein